MPFWKVLIGGALIAATPASATDWRYCLASALDEHKVYMSEPFQTDAPMTAVADAFSRLLDRDRLRHGEIQCPRSDSEMLALTMRNHAIDFNRMNGNEIAKVSGKP
jgi:hypothetical protein